MARKNNKTLAKKRHQKQIEKFIETEKAENAKKAKREAMNSGPTREVKMKKGREEKVVRGEMDVVPHFVTPPVCVIPTKPAPVSIASLREQISDRMTIEPSKDKNVIKVKYGSHKNQSGGIEKRSTILKKTKNKYITLAKSKLSQMLVEGEQNKQYNGYGAKLKF